MEGARLSQPVVDPAYKDPRSRIVIDDAKSYFARGRERYDIIVSEPSNPWVSGVASLFTEEFYRGLGVSLNDGGVMAQWLHTYEMDDATMPSIFAAVQKTFPDFVVYWTIDSDIVVIARKGGAPGRFDAKVLQWPAVKAFAERLKIGDIDAIDRRLLGHAATVRAVFKSYRAPANSDYYPIVDLQSARTRFLQARVTALTDLQMAPLPLLEMLDGSFRPSMRRPDSYAWALVDAAAMTAWSLRDTSMGERGRAASAEFSDTHHVAAQLVELWSTACPAALPFEQMLPHFVSIAGASAHLPARTAVEMWKRLGDSACAKRLSSADHAWFDLFAAAAARDPDNMSAVGATLLEATRGTRSAATEYAFLAALAGHVCRGRTGPADVLFEQGARDWIRPGMHALELRYLYFLSHDPDARPVAGAACVTASR